MVTIGLAGEEINKKIIIIKKEKAKYFLFFIFFYKIPNLYFPKFAYLHIFILQLNPNLLHQYTGI
jgi:hypothetical protein